MGGSRYAASPPAWEEGSLFWVCPVVLEARERRCIPRRETGLWDGGRRLEESLFLNIPIEGGTRVDGPRFFFCPGFWGP